MINYHIGRDAVQFVTEMIEIIKAEEEFKHIDPCTYDSPVFDDHTDKYYGDIEWFAERMLMDVQFDKFDPSELPKYVYGTKPLELDFGSAQDAAGELLWDWQAARYKSRQRWYYSRTTADRLLEYSLDCLNLEDFDGMIDVGLDRLQDELDLFAELNRPIWFAFGWSNRFDPARDCIGLGRLQRELDLAARVSSEELNYSEPDYSQKIKLGEQFWIDAWRELVAYDA